MHKPASPDQIADQIASPPVDNPWRLIVDSAIDYAIISCDASARVTTWNEGARRILGWTETEIAGQSLDRIFTPEDQASGAFEQELATAATKGHATDERWHVRKDGGRFWASGEIMRMVNDAGQPAGFVKILRDRTEERNAAAERQQLAQDLQFVARASEELARLSDYQATLDTVARLAVPGFADWCTVDILEPGSTLTRVAMAHADPEKLKQAQELHRRYPPDPMSTTGTWEVIRSGKPQLVSDVTPQRLQDRVPDAERRSVVASLGLCSYIAAPLAARGEPFGVLSFATAESGRRYNEADLALAVDLARRAAVAIENAKLLAALRDADRAKDVFMATLAHELRNPLAPIWNGLSIIKRVSGDAGRVEQVTAMIERQVGQMSRLVDDLLDVSRIGTGKIELKKTRTSLIRVINAAVEMSRPHIEAAQHKLSLSFPNEPSDVMGDSARLAQVFANLLNNAAKYTRRGGLIEVVVETQPSQLVVRVRDNGTGIAPEMLSRVFGLFTQVTQPDERRQGGLGIGLSLVDGLVRLHGGKVEARSAGLDKGSEFVVYLPRLERESATPGTPADARDPTQPQAAPGAPLRRILVVDDNVDAATTVADLLSMTGNEVDVVHDGRSAVEHTASFKPDVVLLDIGLPDISGYEAARRIRRLEGVRQPLLIALTGWGQQQDKQLAKQAGFDQHWTKPVDPARLLALASR
ncbi:MAG TPA: ATP-binding protein [Ramlibacter sp.]|nr:ATP-binding protein [Ramlibacter sp.]